MKSRLNFKIIYEDGKVFDMHNKGYWVNSFHILSPNFERETRENKASDGERLKRSKKKSRNVYVSFLIEADNLEEFEAKKHEIFNVFSTDNPFTIIRDITPTKKIEVIQEGEYDIENLTESDGEVTVVLKMLDPYIHGDSTSLQLSNSFHPYTITGNAKTTWKSRTVFNSQTSNYRIENNVGGKVILNYPFISGDVLEIDYKKRKVSLNGNSLAVAILLQSDWQKFILKPGTVQLKASHPTSLTYIEKFH
ncbi:phage tail domain-containing protein [Alkalihalobacillus sp. LMS39]|uniref:phage distal tail protein n=1 Tax=Alkalihalobacillus sp. LMS39 TaxID=2924032 RepID=UPI001FB2B3C9|nr:phage tail domain-containing protein [Alkalihalobacillus sp. LMS39]UOE96079.1 phage tail family protein [Alkalihalobacillus sp. LMS39]